MGQYDPMGIVTPLMVKGKLLMQSHTVNNPHLGWDESLPENAAADWARYINLVLNFLDLRIPRSIVVPNGQEPWLVIFTDASSVAMMGAVAYVQWRIPVWDLQEAKSTLVMSKSRVAPTKGSTVPRLELQALVIGTRLALTILRAIDWKFSKVVVMTDSACNVAALQRPGSVYRPYFQHRLGEIQDNLAEMETLAGSVDPVYHLPGAHNAADIITRGEVQLDQLSADSTWVTGPVFMHGPFQGWPINPAPSNEVPAKEVKLCNVVECGPSLADKLN